MSNNTLKLYYERKTVRKYKSFKWVLSGRWNQGSGNSGATATYMQWDELGIGFDNGNVCYGPSYWTYDSYTLDGTPWAPDMRMPDALLDGERNTEYSKFDASSFVELTVYFHTADNNAILPTSVGLIAANGQSSYESSTPLHFMLYGLNEQANEYELLIDVGASDVNRTNNAETIVSTGFTYHYDVQVQRPLVTQTYSNCLTYVPPAKYITGMYNTTFDFTTTHGNPPYNSRVTIPFANTTAATASQYCNLISTTAYRNGTSKQATVNNCLKINKASDVSLIYDVNIGTERAVTFTGYIGICTASNLSDWQNNSVILDSVVKSNGSGYTWWHWTGSCSATNVSGILFFATQSNGGTSNYPRLFGGIDSVQTTVVTQE